MNFVYENDRVAGSEESLFPLGFLDNIPYLLNPTTNST
jgi:hypothetical protein